MKKNQWTLVTNWEADVDGNFDWTGADFGEQKPPGSEGKGRNHIEGGEPQFAGDCDPTEPAPSPGSNPIEPIEAAEEGRRVVARGLSWTASGIGDPGSGSSWRSTAEYRLYEVTEFVIF